MLAQGTEFVRQFFLIKSKKLAIAEEMLELKMILEGGAKSARKSALSYGKNENFNYVIGSQLTSPVYESFYHEVAHKFTDWQRYNIRTFHSHLNFYNNSIDWIEKLKSGEVTQNEVILKLFNAYKQASFAVLYIEESNKNGGKTKVDDDFPKLVELKERIDEDVKKLSLTNIVSS